MLKIRFAEKSEIDWINTSYEEVGFVPSCFYRDVIAIAEWDGQRAGLARLVTIDEKNLELGGVYVLESFRGKGIAKELVHFLLKHVKRFQTVYCIPFEYLLSFYQQCGFATCYHLEQVPKKIFEKYSWCKETYSQPTSLMILSH